MKTISIIVLSLFGVGAHADVVECVNSKGSATYLPGPMTFEFSGPNSGDTVNPVSVAIVGEPHQINPREEYIAVYKYELANGQIAEITWQATQYEILGNIRTRAGKMELKSSSGEIVDQYGECNWQASIP